MTLITESLFLELTSNTQVQARSSKAPTRVWGAAYHIPAEHAAEVKEYLDIREINGYSIEYVAFHPYSPNSTSSAAPVSAPATIRTLLYIGLPSNPQFLGVQSQEAVAQRIAVSVGPSGKNSEYLFNLQAALGSLIGEDVSAVDEHIDDLVKRVRELEKVGVHRRRGSFKKQDSNDSQREEVEEIEVTR